MDYREPAVRYELFMKFYEYHLRLKAHPGCVYFIFPWMFAKHKFTMEQKLWFVYLNGVTQNPMTTWRIFKAFPDPANLDLRELDAWHLSTHESGEPMWKTLSYDIDRRYQKGHLVKMVDNYLRNVYNEHDNQYDFFMSFCYDNSGPLNEYEAYDNLWQKVRNDFFMFGRLSSFSYIEYLKIAGIPVDCSTLLLGDMSGSLSHRNGLLKVLGMDEWEQHKKINPGVKHNKEIVALAENFGDELIMDAQNRFQDEDFYGDVNYFTLESTLCCFKSWFRTNRRYGGVYIDMMYDRIIDGYERWGVTAEEKEMWLACRRDCLPEYARAGGINKEKQNHFRLTGEVINLGNMFPDNFEQGLEIKL